MTKNEIISVFGEENDEFLRTENIKPERLLHRRPDINAFLLLDKLCPGDRDIICSAEHDEFWLDVGPVDMQPAATREDVLDLIRCGVRLDRNTETLVMFV